MVRNIFTPSLNSAMPRRVAARPLHPHASSAALSFTASRAAPRSSEVHTPSPFAVTSAHQTIHPDRSLSSINLLQKKFDSHLTQSVAKTSATPPSNPHIPRYCRHLRPHTSLTLYTHIHNYPPAALGRLPSASPHQKNFRTRHPTLADETQRLTETYRLVSQPSRNFFIADMFDRNKLRLIESPTDESSGVTNIPFLSFLRRSGRTRPLGSRK